MCVPDSSPREMKVPRSAMARMMSLTEASWRMRSGVLSWSDDHEVAVHHEATVDEVAAVDVALLGGRSMYEDDVRVAGGGHPEGRAGADGDDLDLDPAFLLEAGDQHVEQPAVLRAGRRRQDDRGPGVRGAHPGSCNSKRENGRNEQENGTAEHGRAFERSMVADCSTRAATAQVHRGVLSGPAIR